MHAKSLSGRFSFKFAQPFPFLSSTAARNAFGDRAWASQDCVRLHGGCFDRRYFDLDHRPQGVPGRGLGRGVCPHAGPLALSDHELASNEDLFRVVRKVLLTRIFKVIYPSVDTKNLLLRYINSMTLLKLKGA